MKEGDGEGWRKAAAAGMAGGELQPSGTKGVIAEGLGAAFSHVGC